MLVNLNSRDLQRIQDYTTISEITNALNTYPPEPGPPRAYYFKHVSSDLMEVYVRLVLSTTADMKIAEVRNWYKNRNPSIRFTAILGTYAAQEVAYMLTSGHWRHYIHQENNAAPNDRCRCSSPTATPCGWCQNRGRRIAEDPAVILTAVGDSWNISHQERHVFLHRNLRELVTDYATTTGRVCGSSSITELFRWSDAQTRHPNSASGVYMAMDVPNYYPANASNSDAEHIFSPLTNLLDAVTEIQRNLPGHKTLRYAPDVPGWFIATRGTAEVEVPEQTYPTPEKAWQALRESAEISVFPGPILHNNAAVPASPDLPTVPLTGSLEGTYEWSFSPDNQNLRIDFNAGSNSQQTVVITPDGDGITIRLPGYETHYGDDGVIALNISHLEHGGVSLSVWADRNQDDPTSIIGFQAARLPAPTAATSDPASG